jgi:hypothetical protein
MKIVVIGGGVLGVKLVTWLRQHGHLAVAASPQDGADNLAGDGLANALTDAGADPRAVVTDSHATFFGTELGERTLLPGAGAVLGRTRFRDWPSPTSHLEER